MSTDEKQPELIEEEKKPPFKIDGVQWLSETIEIRALFRIKGKQGIFSPLANPNKAGMVRMERFMSPAEAYTVHRSKLETLDGLIIYKDNTDTITLLDAFDNLQEHWNNKETDDHSKYEPAGQMDIICPKYDPDKFKHHHAKKIVKWYDEIITAINNATE